MKVKGIHHVTAVSADIQGNFDFYTKALGMRLVKRSVNQDDVSAYHLFYADGVGTPGTDLTFFDWAVPREKRGTHAIVRTGLRVSGDDALPWWDRRFRELGIQAQPITEVDGRATLSFEDTEGQRLALIDDGNTGDPSTPWDGGPVPGEMQVRGLGPITLSVPNVESTEAVLTVALGLKSLRQYNTVEGDPVFVYGLETNPGPSAEVHLIQQPGLPVTRPGAGGVHHVAFRVDDAAYEEWSRRLNELGIRNSGPVDRYYFRSLYFREPNGILFELATDGPGFAVDEDPATLGEKVVLPPFLENQRSAIVANLKPIHD